MRPGAALQRRGERHSGTRGQLLNRFENRARLPAIRYVGSMCRLCQKCHRISDQLFIDQALRLPSITNDFIRILQVAIGANAQSVTRVTQSFTKCTWEGLRGF